MSKIIPLNVQKEEASEAKAMMMESLIDTAFNDPMIRQKATKLFGIFAKPAFRQLVGLLGEDEMRLMMYKDAATGMIVFHKLKVKPDTSADANEEQGEMKVTTPDGRKVILKADGTWKEIPFDEQDSSVILEFMFTNADAEKDLFTIEESDLGSLDVLIKKVATKFGMKMGGDGGGNGDDDAGGFGGFGF